MQTEYSSSQDATSLQELTCHMGSHGVTCHPAELTFPHSDAAEKCLATTE